MAGRKLDQIVVVDVESTCWKGEPPSGQESEIVEIGGCLLRIETGERSGKECILVRPRVSTVSAYCTQLTTLTQEQVNQGISFLEACQILTHNFKGRERVWASYGDYDRRMFEQQCKRDGMEYPFSPVHINVKSLFAIMQGLRAEIGMSSALRKLGLQLEGTHHRGGDDAWNIAAILSRIILSSRPARSLQSRDT